MGGTWALRRTEEAAAERADGALAAVECLWCNSAGGAEEPERGAGPQSPHERRDDVIALAEASLPDPIPAPLDEPVASAKATGIAASAEPIPSATARAPTRPT